MTLGRRQERIEDTDSPGGQPHTGNRNERWTGSRRVWVPLSVVALLIFALLGFAAHTHSVLPGDVGFTTGLQRIHAGAFQRLMVLVSKPGYPPWAEIIEAAGIVALLLSRRRLEALFLTLTLLADGAAALIKVIVARPRPSPQLVEVLLRLGSFSFPSGHVVHYTVFYGFLAFVLVMWWRSSWPRNIMLAICVALIALVGFSRIYLGEHWLTDVIGGYLFG
ncbi:MAG: phosphatase PAP2 family protein, partial [Ktedonobacterales bacterium]